MDLAKLQAIVTRVKAFLGEKRHLNESDTKRTLIEPLLAVLGWNIFDPDEVQQEYRYRKQAEPADYGLFIGEERALLVEAKPLSDPLRTDKGWRQLSGNGLNAGFQWCARMNGRCVILVNLQARGELERKIFWQVDLADVAGDDPEALQAVADLLRLASRSSLADGTTDSAWQQHEQSNVATAAVHRVLCDPPPAVIAAVREAARTPALPEEVVRKVLARYVGTPTPGTVLPPAVTPAARQTAAPTDGDADWGVRSYKGPLLIRGSSVVLSKYRPLLQTTEEVQVSLGHVRHTAEALCALARAGRDITLPAIRSQPDGPKSGGPTQRALAAMLLAGAIALADVQHTERFEVRDALTAESIVERVLREAEGAPSTSRALTTSPAAAKQTYTPDDHLSGKPQSQAIFDALVQRTRNTVGDFTVHANAKHVVLGAKSAFVVVSVQKSGLRIGLRLDPGEINKHPRLKAQPKGVFEGWGAMHVSLPLGSVTDVDDEVVGLVKESYQAASR